MPYYKRRRRTSSATSTRAARYKRYITRYRRSYVPRPPANNSSRSRVCLHIPVTSYLLAPVQPNTPFSAVIAINPWTYNPGSSGLFRVCRSFTSLTASPLYRTYCTLYDEVRIKGMYVNIGSANPVAVNGDFMFLKFHHVWDRKGTVYELRDDNSELWNNETPNQEAHLPDAREIAESTRPVLMLQNNVVKFRTKCVASDLLERCAFHDCTVQQNGTGYADAAWESEKNNVNYFSPVLYFVFKFDSVTTMERLLALLVNVDYYVEFRNPKFSPYASYVSASAKGVSTAPDLLTDAPSLKLSDPVFEPKDPTIIEDEDTKML